MARYYKYLCPNCGYEVWANPRGYDVLRSGLHIDFLCKNCQEIVSISPSGMDDILIVCPDCKKPVASTWNPIDGHCPKCKEKLKETKEGMLAD